MSDFMRKLPTGQVQPVTFPEIDQPAAKPSRSQREILPARIQPGCIYSRQDILFNLRINARVLTAWIAAGLRPLDTGSQRCTLFLSDDLIAFFRRRQVASTDTCLAAEKMQSKG